MYHIKEDQLHIELTCADPNAEAPAIAGALITLLQSLFAFDRPPLEAEEKEAAVTALDLLRALQPGCQTAAA